MTQEEQKAFFNNFVNTMREVMIFKGMDYSNQDKLSNFKLAGDICGIGAELNCLSLIATKVARLGVLLNAKNAPNNESIQDSILDLANYTLLLAMILKDNEIETIDLIKQ